MELLSLTENGGLDSSPCKRLTESVCSGGAWTLLGGQVQQPDWPELWNGPNWASTGTDFLGIGKRLAAVDGEGEAAAAGL